MNTEFRRRVTDALAAHFGLTTDACLQSGTMVHPVAEDAWDGWLELIPVGARVGIDVPPAHEDALRALVNEHTPDHVLTASDFTAAWGAERVRIGHMKVYALDATCFTPVKPATTYTVRALTRADQAAFEAFQATCTPAELGEADVNLEQVAPYGVFHGERIVAAASTYLWLGMVDVGVLTDPAFRRQGLGKAAVSAVCQHVLDENERIACYRHGLSNLGSQGIAEGVGFSLYATVEAVAPLGG